jgi:hypothetical protein
MLRLNRITGIFPGSEAAQDRGDVFETIVEQDPRRTGAGMLVKSGAVGDDPLVGIQFGQAGWDIRQGKAQRAGDVAKGIV